MSITIDRVGTKPLSPLVPIVYRSNGGLLPSGYKLKNPPAVGMVIERGTFLAIEPQTLEASLVLSSDTSNKLKPNAFVDYEVKAVGSEVFVTASVAGILLMHDKANVKKEWLKGIHLEENPNILIVKQ